jgi:hypothetical protein
MADIPVPGYQAFWIGKRKTLNAESKRLLSQSPDADTQLKRLFKVLCDIEDVAGYTPAAVGDSHPLLTQQKRTGGTSVKPSMGRLCTVPCMARTQLPYKN